jgi:hypothetical protein
LCIHVNLLCIELDNVLVQWQPEDGYSADASISMVVYTGNFLVAHDTSRCLIYVFPLPFCNWNILDVEGGWNNTIYANVNNCSLPCYNELSECARSGLAR